MSLSAQSPHSIASGGGGREGGRKNRRKEKQRNDRHSLGSSQPPPPTAGLFGVWRTRRAGCGSWVQCSGLCPIFSPQYGKKKLKYLPYNHQHEYFFLSECRAAPLQTWLHPLALKSSPAAAKLGWKGGRAVGANWAHSPTVGPPLLIPMYFQYQIIMTMVRRKDWVVSVGRGGGGQTARSPLAWRTMLPNHRVHGGGSQAATLPGWEGPSWSPSEVRESLSLADRQPLPIYPVCVSKCHLPRDPVLLGQGHLDVPSQLSPQAVTCRGPGDATFK